VGAEQHTVRWELAVEAWPRPATAPDPDRPPDPGEAEGCQLLAGKRIEDHVCSIVWWSASGLAACWAVRAAVIV
jgi:hypothetical protein